MLVDLIRSGDPVGNQLSTNHLDGGNLQWNARLESNRKVRISCDMDQANLSQELIRTHKGMRAEAKKKKGKNF